MKAPALTSSAEINYSSLFDFCDTDHQRELVHALTEHGSIAAATRSLGRTERNVYRTLRMLKKRAARNGHAPGHFNSGTAPGYTMQKATIQRGADGEIERTWERQIPAAERAAQSIIECLENLKYKPAPKFKQPKRSDKDLLTLYTITDFHLAMYAYGAETGEDWDTDIAEKVLINAILELSENSPNSENAILNVQGDFLHWDGIDAVTPMSGHILDADTRLNRMVELALTLVCQSIEILLKKHKHVKLIVCEGNHDMAGSVWLQKSMQLIYRDNKRLEVDNTAFPFYAHLHGKTMIAFHHGHRVKNRSLPALFASEPRYREMWGQATYTYVHTGHYHQTEQDMGEHGGAIVERHPTLAARDAYAARGGYVSRRGARAITYHKEHGETHRYTVLPRT